jgi:NAD(P)H-dependent FMN reductase
MEFHERIRAADTVLFVTPEHNRSVPAALNNFLALGDAIVVHQNPLMARR